MKQFIGTLLLLFSMSGIHLAAQDQFPGAESIFLYGHPRFITGANSAAGSPILSTGSYSLNMNPALTAGLQSLSADLGYTGVLRAADTDNMEQANAFRLGVSLPNRFGVFTGAFQGAFAKKGLMLGDALVGRAGFSRDLTDNFYLGLSVSGGGLLNEDKSDFYVAADVGAWYRLESLAFLRQVRFGLVLQNLGKSFTHINGYDVRSFPAIFTPKFGVAAHVLEMNKLVAGVSADIAIPTFSNILINAGIQAEIAGLVYVSAGWDFNLYEVADDYKPGVHLPYIGVGVKFSLNTSGSELMSKRGFDQTDINVDAVWQRLHKDTHLYSIGAAASFGVRDTIPPDIKIGDIRYE